MPHSQHPFRAQAGLAAVLALIAGYADSYGFLNHNVFVSFMSGNTTMTGLGAGQADFAQAGRNALPVPCFVAGVFAGVFLVRSSRQLRRLFVLVAALLAACLAGAYLGPLSGWVSVVLLSLAMGVMNSAVTLVGGQVVSLAYVTGDLNNLGQHLASATRGAPVPQAQGAWDTHGRRATLLAGLWIAFFLGAVLGGAATPHFAAWTLLPPVLGLAALAALNREHSPTRTVEADDGKGSDKETGQTL